MNLEIGDSLRDEIAQYGISELLGDNFIDLTHDECLLVVNQAQVLFSEYFVHLKQKEASKAIRPHQQLRLLRTELEERSLENDHSASGNSPMSSVEFHKRMMDIFLAMKDGHTRYIPWHRGEDATAQLPFRVRRYRCICNGGSDRYVVSLNQNDLDEYIERHKIRNELETFEHAVEVTHWNGVEIKTAIEKVGEDYYGSNADAHRAEGIYHLTNRNLKFGRTPTEDLVTLTYIPNNKRYRKPREIQFGWEINNKLIRPNNLKFGDQFALQERTSQLFFGPRCSCDSENSPPLTVNPITIEEKCNSESGCEPEEKEYRPEYIRRITLLDNGNQYLYVGVFSFHQNQATRINQVFNLLVKEKRKYRGLIIDIRGNRGGKFVFAEQLLRLLSPEYLQPTLFQIRPTNRMLDLSYTYPMFSSWNKSLLEGVRTGAQYSTALPISLRTDIETRDTIDQSWIRDLFELVKGHSLNKERWKIPLCVLADARCYSSADIFAAGIADNDLGEIIGPDRVTGAGGASTFSHKALMDFYPDETISTSETRDNPEEYIREQLLSDRWVLAAVLRTYRTISWIICISEQGFESEDTIRFRKFLVNPELFGDNRINVFDLALDRDSIVTVYESDSPPAYLESLANDIDAESQIYAADKNHIAIYDSANKATKFYRYQRAHSTKELSPLPGIGLNFSLFRVIRNKTRIDGIEPDPNSGIPLEDIGVDIDQIHPTRADVCTDHDEPEIDLINEAIRRIESMLN